MMFRIWAQKFTTALRSRLNHNEFADGVEIAEEDIAGALERDLRAFIDSENTKRLTGRIANYTPADHARAVG